MNWPRVARNLLMLSCMVCFQLHARSESIQYDQEQGFIEQVGAFFSQWRASANDYQLQTIPVQRYRQPITAVDVEGNINVRLHTGQRTKLVVAHGDARDIARLSATVKHGVLFLSMNKKTKHAVGMKPYQYKPLQVDVSVRSLRRLVYRGKGQLTGSGLQTRGLDLWLKNSGKTRLEGALGLHQLTLIGPGKTQLIGVSGQHVAVKLVKSPKVQLKGTLSIDRLEVHGQGLFSAYWLKNSGKLTVRATDAARIQLAGVVTQLDLELWGHSQFYGRYLRADESFVKTHDNALAELTTTEQQHTFAQDNSDILFYNEPSTRNDFMAESGAVLPLSEWD